MYLHMYIRVYGSMEILQILNYNKHVHSLYIYIYIYISTTLSICINNQIKCIEKMNETNKKL